MTIHNSKLFLKYGKNIPFKFSSGNFPFVLGAFAQLVTTVMNPQDVIIGKFLFSKC